MQYCVDHPEEISKLAKVKAQVSEVKGVMMENIEKVLFFTLLSRYYFLIIPCWLVPIQLEVIINLVALGS